MPQKMECVINFTDNYSHTVSKFMYPVKDLSALSIESMEWSLHCVEDRLLAAKEL